MTTSAQKGVLISTKLASEWLGLSRVTWTKRTRMTQGMSNGWYAFMVRRMASSSRNLYLSINALKKTTPSFTNLNLNRNNFSKVLQRMKTEAIIALIGKARTWSLAGALNYLIIKELNSCCYHVTTFISISGIKKTLSLMSVYLIKLHSKST